jgi:hypothetical protein
MIIFDADFVGIAVLPPERDAVLIVHSAAVSSSLIALQQLEPVAPRDDEIIQASGNIKELQFTLNDAPELTRYSTSRAGAPLAKEISCRLVRKRRGSHGLHTTRVTNYAFSQTALRKSGRRQLKTNDLQTSTIFVDVDPLSAYTCNEQLSKRECMKAGWLADFVSEV